MAYWREEGEVRDSEEDEEELDSQEYDLFSGALRNPIGNHGDVDELQLDTPEICDIPGDPEPPQSSPLSSLPDIIEISSSSDIDPRSPPSAPNDASPKIDLLRLFSSSIGEKERPNQTARLERSPPSPTPPSTTPDVQNEIESDDGTEDAPEPRDDDDAEVLATAWDEDAAGYRPGRSLRPRKPIQEHPYLLENVQYSKLFKSHGVKPLRVAEAQEEQREQREQQKAPQEDSQEQEFEEETQETGSSGGFDPSAEVVSCDTREPNALNQNATSSSQTRSPHVIVWDIESSAPVEYGSDNTSASDDELPPLSEISANITRTNRKRKRTPSKLDSAPSKRPNTIAPVAPSSPVPVFRHVHEFASVQAENRTGSRSLEVDASGDRPLEAPGSEPWAPREPAPAVEGHEVMEIESGSESDGSEDSDSGSEIVRHAGRRIRGVLPASWLRLDQQSCRDKLQRNVTREVHERPTQAIQRRGVAQPAVGRGLAATQRDESFGFSSGSEEGTPQSPGSLRRKGTAPSDNAIQTVLVVESDVEDSDGSVVVEDEIDRMLPSRKRNGTWLESFQKMKKPQKRMPQRSKTSSSATKKQTKMLASLPKKTRHSAPKTHLQPRKVGTRNAGSRSRQSQTRPAKRKPPPRLSILDVIEPNAPQFLKVAARTASRRRDKGRAALGSKSICLADRHDNVDAISTLTSWRVGQLAQRVAVVERPREVATDRMRSDRAQNLATSPCSGRMGQKLRKETTADGRTFFRPESGRETRNLDATSGSRTAQLEIDEIQEPGRLGFNARKRFLDRFFKQSGKAESLDSDDLAHHNGSGVSSPSAPGTTNRADTPHNVRPARKHRDRKQAAPRHVDVNAPQFTHSNDPVIDDLPAPADVSSADPHAPEKLQGLGPYGTRYTQHFEVFPLDEGVFFHETTLIGSGALQAVTNLGLAKLNREPAGRKVCFTTDCMQLEWAEWNDRVSAELGILSDRVAEWVETLQYPAHRGTVAIPNQELDFIREYMTTILDLSEVSTRRFVADKVADSFGQLHSRIESIPLSGQGDVEKEQLADVSGRCLLISLAARQLCHGCGDLCKEMRAAEGLVSSFSKACVKVLLSIGLHRLRQTYVDLRTLRNRERGIQCSDTAMNAWVVVFRALETARIQRASFWDIVYSTLDTMGLRRSTDARRFESLWKDWFSLLPICEFDDRGILRSGSRHTPSVGGWNLPQDVLRRVFDIYKANTRQSPTFNDYCRTLVARCHYLVEQWGWFKSAGVVGVIFDFFATQGLSHLRNEEAFTSPKFLENLTSDPSLRVEPEDRCFHIFLKLLALVIKRLRKHGFEKDILNTVSRTTPNHSRQYLKEHTVHERDLASLRNHHDILCTLFWAAPPELRSSANKIRELVIPSNSHKEACLINLRAWAQLAKFIVHEDEVAGNAEIFASWQQSVFQQVLAQFDSAASDIQQQFLDLAKDVSRSIDESMVRAMISMNKAAALDVLHFSAKMSRDALGQARSLDAAVFSLNSWQLAQIFSRFTRSPPDFDWSILGSSLDSLQHFLKFLDEIPGEEQDPVQVQSAVRHMNHAFGAKFFSMTRCLLANCDETGRTSMSASEQAVCVEKSISIAASLALRFSRSGFMRLTEVRSIRGPYSVFAGKLGDLGPKERRHFALFCSVLLGGNYSMPIDLGTPLLVVWVLSILKPRAYLSFEHRLGETLVGRGHAFVPESVAHLHRDPAYSTNRDMFEYAISFMRQSVANASQNQRSQLISEYAQCLREAMALMKNDLRILAPQKAEHAPFVVFVRDVISLIRAHASEFCSVDEFFYQINPEYSPPEQDPRLHVAGMISYGLRMREGDSRVVPQLFYYLYNQVKMALVGNKVADESRMLREGMGSRDIFVFVLAKMMPGVLRAGFLNCNAFGLLDVYAKALFTLLADDAVPQEIRTEDMVHVLSVYRVTIAGVDRLRRSCAGSLGRPEVHVLLRSLSILNSIWPSLRVIPYLTVAPDCLEALLDALRQFGAIASAAAQVIKAALRIGVSDIPATAFDVMDSLNVDQRTQDRDVVLFCDSIVADVSRNWVRTEGGVMIKVPGKSASGPGTSGVKLAGTMEIMAIELLAELEAWLEHWEMMNGRAEEGREAWAGDRL